MKPAFVSHADYQRVTLDRLRQYYTNGAAVLVRRDWPVIWKCLISDLSHTTTFLRDRYADQGPAPRDPASMLRSYLLFLLVKPEIGLTKWVDELHRVPLYAILSGFEPGDIPGVGTFYDFLSRFWDADEDNLKPKKKPVRRKPKRGKKGEKAPTTSPGKVERLVKRLLRSGLPFRKQPFDRLLEFFQSQIVAVSAKLSLLGDPQALAIAGDGTPVVTAAFPRSKPLCDCHARGIAKCHHPRLYSQPDCDLGWDSAREKYVSGYHLYMLTAANSHHDLPLYPRLQPASRHDAVSFVVSTVEFSQRFTLGMVEKMLLDAAHDASAIYDLLQHQGVQPFIDLNKRATKFLQTVKDMKISPKGIPICPAGKPMKPYGYDHTRNRQKWMCPMMQGRTTNTCATPCSDAKYGRTYHTCGKDNPRLFPSVLRGSQTWKLIYKRRTSVERSKSARKLITSSKLAATAPPRCGTSASTAL
ncbi:transposase [Cohnella massiliensis]|uniref:transposase n=1 Tax=Cohnella massiliensis TaxID=1816691 RepID=UPI001FEB78AE|nr:transposase [Cohnella massiliensis]